MTRAALLLGLVVAATVLVVATFKDARDTATGRNTPALVARTIAGVGTSRASLTRTVERMTTRLTARPDDGEAAVLLADALVRVQRVNNDGRAAIAAEDHLRTFLARAPGHYAAERMLATVLLSAHRFGEAIAQANKASARDPRDAWNYGTMGDGYLELGDYDRAFAAFDTMARLKPGPPVYARIAYALELKGDLPGALEYMRRAADGTTPNDEESQAWHFTQIGLLQLQQGRLGDAKREFERAEATFAGHPLAIDGIARIKIVEGDLAAARQLYQEQLAKVPTPDLAAVVGDLMLATGDPSSAERYYRMSEQIELAGWGNGAKQPQVLARFLAERDRDIPRAVALADEAASARRDIFTLDTQAWAYFKAGRLPEAGRTAQEALRTGTRDARILYHAAEIAAASGDRTGALETLNRIPAPHAVADLHVANGIASLRRRL
jgi:tetratricopeptide (TPR) repeat protein